MELLRRFRQNLAFRVGAVFVLLLAVTTVAAVLAIRHVIKQDLESGTRQEMINSMKRLENDFARLRDEVMLLAQLSARASQVQERDALLGAKTLQITVLEESRLHGIHIDEQTARRPVSTEDEVLRRGFSGMKSVDYLLSGDGGPSRLHIMAVAPVETGDEERRVITASVALGREYLRQQKENLGGDISLMTRNEFIASSSQCVACQACLSEVLADEGYWRQITGGKSIYFTFDCEPDPQAAVVFPIRTFGGTTVAMAIFRSRRNEIAALNHATTGVVGGGIGFSIAMSVVFFLLTSKAVRPLRELTRLSAGISEGRYGETVPVRGEDEVGELALAFNRMSISLKQAAEEISEWNRLLESRIMEKTQELEKVHRRMVEVEKLAAIGQLAAGVAHELNNPLSGIMGYAEVALEMSRNKPHGGFTPEEEAKLLSYFRNIETLTQRCRTIIIDMLTFARQHSEEPAAIRINDIIRQTIAFLDKQLAKNKVEVETEFREGLPVLNGNPLQLQQVFTNLILNASQAMPEGGRVIIRTQRSGNAVEAQIRDSGVGITPENRPRIFEPFFTTKPVGEGTGLGLSVSYGIIQRHGGDILVESEPGKGAVFTVVLPIHRAA